MQERSIYLRDFTTRQWYPTKTYHTFHYLQSGKFLITSHWTWKSVTYSSIYLKVIHLFSHNFLTVLYCLDWALFIKKLQQITKESSCSTANDFYFCDTVWRVHCTWSVFIISSGNFKNPNTYWTIFLTNCTTKLNTWQLSSSLSRNKVRHLNFCIFL